MANMTDLLPFVLPHVAGCPDPVALSQIVNAAIRFCRETKIYQRELDKQTILPNVSIYDVSPPDDQTVVSEILELRIAGLRANPVTLDNLNEQFEDWPNRTGTPTTFFFPNKEQVQLVVTPNLKIMNGLYMRAALYPAPTATTLDDEIFNRYYQEIAEGAISNIMALPGKPYSNPQLAMVHGNLFESCITNRAIEAQKSFTRADLRVQMRPFA